ncbi:Nup93/Nic96-domain-containing protein [Parasitella parasitica]|nr:Nup93/Nic96-domain-containing protein [Parasitella parasitica]
MSGRFKKLLQDSKELPSLSTKYDSPKLQHDLNQLGTETNLITSKIDASSKGNNVMGHYFLAQGGANTHENSQHLKDIDTRFTFQPTQTIKKTNVEAHLKQVQETYMTETVDESRRKTRQRVLDSMNEQRNSHWRLKKNTILQEWDLEEDNKTFGHSNNSKDSQRIQLMKEQKKAYAAAVMEVNEKRITEQSIPIVDMFTKLSKTISCTNSQRVSMDSSWDIISHLTCEKTDRIYGAYMNNKYDAYKILSMKQRLIKAARSYLESQFVSVVNETLRKNAAAANVGGSLSREHRLNAYMRLQFNDIKSSSWGNANLEVHNNTPIWLFTYLLIRCGYYSLAVEFVEENFQHFSHAPEFRAIFKEFCANANFDISEENRIRINQQYQSMKYSNGSHDPYKMLLYKIIGRCELQHKTEDIVRIIEDSLWLQLMLIRETPEDLETNRQVYRLSEFQDIVCQADHTKYDKDGLNPWFYFNMLLLSLQFEKAVDYLHGYEEFRVQAVHLGIVFVYYGLARIPSKPNRNIYDILDSKLDASNSLNYTGMISQYVRTFSPDECKDALQYLYLLTLYPDQEIYTCCYEKLIQLIVQCTDFKGILGDKTTYRAGLIDKYKPLLDFQPYNNKYENLVLTPVANTFQNIGRYKDSVYVFELLGSYEEALRVLNREIYRVITRYNSTNQTDLLINPMQDLAKFCVDTCAKYDKNCSLQDLDIVKTHTILLSFLRATLENHAKDLDKALEYIKRTDVLPPQGGFYVVKSYVNNFQHQDDFVRNLLPYIILIALEEKSNCVPISTFLTLGEIQIPTSLQKRIDQKIMQTIAL